MPVVKANGIEIAYERTGEGSPLVFVHGAAEDGRVWQRQLTDLADEFTVVAWDEPGAGRSSDLPPGFGLADYADCLAAVIEDVALGPAHLAGLSWGGTVVLELYRLRPDLVATLVLNDTYAGWKGSLPAEEVRARVEGAHQMLAAPAAEFDPSFPGLFAGDPPAEFVPLLTELAASVRPASLGACLDVMAEADLRDVLPTIDVPALLVWGELDVRSPLSVAREFEAAIPDATLVVIPGAGHVSHLEAPDRFNSAVREFCRAHLPRTLGGLVSQAVELPGGELRVLQPAESADLPDSGPVKWAPIAPYWSVLWRSGVALAQELDTIDLRGRRVVELGCGLGLPSLVAARGGADVLATDASPEALVLLERNAELNGLEIETATVDWGEPDELVERGPFDLVLAADVLYEPASIDALIELMPRLAPVAWLADPGRLEVVAFLELAGHSWPIETLDRGLVLLHRLELAGNQRQGDLRIK